MHTKDLIIEVSMRLFAKSCFADVTVRDIAQECGFQASVIYNHFENKEGILDALFDLFLQRSAPYETLANTLDYTLDPTENFRKLLFAYDEAETLFMGRLVKIIFTEQYRCKKAADIVCNNIIGGAQKNLNTFFQRLEERGIVKKHIYPAYVTIFSKLPVYYAMEYVNGTVSNEKETLFLSLFQSIVRNSE